VASQDAFPSGGILDAHTHILAPEVIANATRYCELDAHFGLLARSPRNRYATAEDLICEMDDAGVAVAVACGFAFRDPDLCRRSNDYIMEAVERYPERLVGFMSLQPNDPGFEAEFRRCLDAGLRGVGELFPDGQGFTLTGPGSDGLSRLADVCRESGVPLLIHVNEKVGHDYCGKGSQGPEEAYRFALEHPGVQVCFAHWGGGLFFYELMPEVRRALTDVYYDTAASPFLYGPGVFGAAKEAGVLGKVMLGTDFPLLGVRRYADHLGAAGLSDDEVRRVVSENAWRFLNLHGRR